MKKTKLARNERHREVLIALRRIIRAVDMQSKRLAKETGLTTPQMVILQAIRDLGEVTTRSLSEAVTLSQATVTTILDRMEQRGLIERYRSTIDRRIVHTRLTAAGEAALRTAPPLLHERFIAAFSDLSGEEKQQIVRTLEQVAGLLGGADLDAAPLLDLRSPTVPDRRPADSNGRKQADLT